MESELAPPCPPPTDLPSSIFHLRTTLSSYKFATIWDSLYLVSHPASFSDTIRKTIQKPHIAHSHRRKVAATCARASHTASHTIYARAPPYPIQKPGPASARGLFYYTLAETCTGALIDWTAIPKRSMSIATLRGSLLEGRGSGCESLQLIARCYIPPKRTEWSKPLYR